MDESLCFDDFVGSDTYEYPSNPHLDDEASAALFRAFTNEAWEGLGTESGLSSGLRDQSAPSTRLGGQTSEATSKSSSPSIFDASSTTERAAKPVPAKSMTGARNISPPTPLTPVIPTPNDALAHSPASGIVSIPPSTLSVNFAEAPIAFANMAPGSAQMPQTLYPPGPAYASQSLSGHTMQGPTHPLSGAVQAPALQPYCAGPMPGPFYPSNVMATAPVAGPYSSQIWSAPVNQGNITTAPSFAVRYPMEMAPPPAPAMKSPTPAQTKKRTWEFASPMTPTGFVANPNNHGRFQYVDGQRIYLNGPKAKKLCSGGTQGK